MNPIYSRKSIRAALKSWHRPIQLGSHPLAQLHIVNDQHTGQSVPPAANERGRYLRRILLQAIQRLQPNSNEPNYWEKQWRNYLILEQQFIARRPPDLIAEELGIARNTYNHQQATALDTLADIFQEMEQTFISDKLNRQRHMLFLVPPRPPYRLVGRQPLLQEIKNALINGHSQALTAFNGWPGVGKTALAIELAHSPDIVKHFCDGILWARLGVNADVLSILGGWGTVLGISQDDLAKLTGIDSRVEAIHTAIGLRRMLFIIDDAWDAAAALAFRVGGPNCTHLVTTRLPEVAVHFAGGNIVKVSELEDDEGIALLAQLAPEAASANKPAIRQLVNMVGGLPLALILIGRYLKIQSLKPQALRLEDLIVELQTVEKRFHLAQPQSPLTRSKDLPSTTPVSLGSVIDISVAQLDAPAKKALRTLSILPAKPNTFSLNVAVALGEDAGNSLEALVAFGLVDLSGERYSLHQTIADYARTWPFSELLVERLVDYFAEYVERYQHEYNALDVEFNNILQVLNTAQSQGGVNRFLRLLDMMYDYFLTRGLYQIAQTQLEKGLLILGKADANGATVLTLYRLGNVMESLGNYDRSQSYYEESLEIAHRNEDQTLVAQLLEGLGELAYNRGQYSEAREFFGQALKAGQAVGQERPEVTIRQKLGNIAYHEGQPDLALEHYETSLARAKRLGFEDLKLILLQNMGAVTFQMGNLEKSKQYLESGLELAYRLDYKAAISGLLESLGTLVSKQGLFVEAENYYKIALGLAREMMGLERISDILANLGAVVSSQGRPDEAKVYLLEALALARQVGHPQIEAHALLNLGEAVAADDDFESADDYLQQGLAIAQERQLNWLGAAILYELGEVHRKQNQWSLAYEQFKDALALAKDNGLMEIEADALFGMAVAALALGRMQEARELGETSLRLYQEYGHWMTAEAEDWVSQIEEYD